MSIQYDPDQVARIKLNDVAADLAIEAAEDFAHAGMEPHDQLMQGVRAYLYACHVMRTPGILNIRPPDTVPLPTTPEEAALMLRLAQMFLARQPGEDVVNEPLAFDDGVKNL